MAIDGLPFTVQGYERAKCILQTKYGRPSEVANAHIQSIISLPTIHGTNPGKIHEFYEKLVTNVQALETIGKLREMNGYVRMTLDKLTGIRADLVRTDDNWQEWKFTHLVEALRKWTERNLLPMDHKRSEHFNEKFNHKQPKRYRIFQAKPQDWKPARTCVYCGVSENKSSECDKVVDVAERQKHLSSKKLCFNCTGTKHRVSECRSKRGCQICSGKHHTSICHKTPDKMLTATGEGTVTYPVVVVIVNGVKCRVLLNTGAGGCFVSEALIRHLGRKPVRREHRRIDMMIHSTKKLLEIYDVNIVNLKGDFELSTEVTKVEKNVLLTIPNPKYQEMLKSHQHLSGITMDDKDEKAELRIHVIIGTNQYPKINTKTPARIGNQGEPIAELTKFGWIIMSPRTEQDLTSMYLTQTSSDDYEQLCSLDVLGLEDQPTGDQAAIYEEFKEQLIRSDEGWYETGLSWKPRHPQLPNNKMGSLGRLSNLVKRLKRQPMLLENYDEIIQEQLAEGIIEKITDEPKGKEFYIPHKSVIRESADSTKIRIVFDGSARANERSPSQNDCLETGSPLQNLLWNVLVRN